MYRATFSTYNPVISMETILNHAFLLSSYLRTKFKLQANSLSGRQLRIRVIFERNYVPPFFPREKERVSRLIIVIMMEEREKGTQFATYRSKTPSHRALIQYFNFISMTRASARSGGAVFRHVASRKEPEEI